MSNSVTKVEIQRSSDNGVWKSLIIRFNILNGIYSEIKRHNVTSEDEDVAVSNLLTVFLPCCPNIFVNADLDKLKSDIVEGFRQLRENDLDGNSLEHMEIAVERIRTHFSCKGENSTPPAVEKNEISQSEVKQKLVNLDKDSTNMKFFEENKCSVCLSSYKEILDDDLHIVVPLCGHPLCCDCADTILKSTKIECPRCRGIITAQSFNLMKFNDNLTMEAQDQTVFL